MTAIVTTCWLDNPEYLAKTIKWVNYYSNIGVADIILLDNNSSQKSKDILSMNCDTVTYQLDSFKEHLTRTSHLEYPYLWRAVHYFNQIFEAGYDKIIYMDNDFYILSDTMREFVENAKGYVSPYCHKHNFPETGLQIVTSDCQEYKDFTNMSQEDFIKKYNGLCMETTLPLTHVEKGLNGDRWSEYGITKQDPNWDFSAQTPLEMFPVFGLK